jgi:hypothetical protein
MLLKKSVNLNDFNYIVFILLAVNMIIQVNRFLKYEFLKIRLFELDV